MRRLLVFGCLLSFCLAGSLGCGKDEKPTGPGSYRPRLPKPPNKKTDQDSKS